MSQRYAIKFSSGKSLKTGMDFLFSKGFVFTCDRDKKLDNRYFYDAQNWRYIFVGHRVEDTGCKMIMNTSKFKSSYSYCTEIRFTKFKKEVLPNW